MKVQLRFKNESFFLQNSAQDSWSSWYNQSLLTKNKSNDWLMYFLNYFTADVNHNIN